MVFFGMPGEYPAHGNRNRMGPCIETYDFICKIFPSLTYYYRSEEPMMAEYLTNDGEGRYFKERYIADVNVPDGEFK